MPAGDTSETPPGPLFWAIAALFSGGATAIISTSVLWRLNPSAISGYVLLGAITVMEAAVLYLCFLQYQSAREAAGDLILRRPDSETEAKPRL